MAVVKKPRYQDAALRRFASVAVVTFLVVFLIIYYHKTNFIPNDDSQPSAESSDLSYYYPLLSERLDLLEENELSIELQRRNRLRPRNVDRYPRLAKDHITMVLYVHNRPQYLKVVVKSLSQVVGISETLLIVSHDGYFEEMNKIVEGITFCQVKQIFAPYSPHIFLDSFPGVSPNDCKDTDDAKRKNCEGNPDQYGNHRSPKIVSLKHHWWWMMNTVWDGLEETRGHMGHILFIEEDHFIFPNAYRNLQILTSLKHVKCPDCYAANLAPSDVKSRGEGWGKLIAERMGNVGYSFNRTVWRKIHKKAKEFCYFDDYNWDITMWATVFPSFGSPVYTLRGPKTSAVHFGKCGLHQGHEENNACIVEGKANILVEDIDRVANIKAEWDVHTYKNQPGYKGGFKGWGGWGDKRDRLLCVEFARMYHFTGSILTYLYFTWTFWSDLGR